MGESSAKPASRIAIALLAGVVLVLATPALAAEGGLSVFEPFESAPALIRMIILIVLFGLLVFPIRALIVTPALRVLDEREERISGARERAEKLQQQAESILSEYEVAVAKAREESESARRSEIDSAHGAQSERIGSARASAEQTLEHARGEIAQAYAEARASIRSEAEALASDVAERVLGRPLS